MDEDQQGRVDRLHQQVADQHLEHRRLRLRSKGLRASASAVVDESAAVRLVVRGLRRDPRPPVATSRRGTG